MPVKLTESSYGKSSVRVKKLIKHVDRHEVVEINVSVICHGHFEQAHTVGNNENILPTDTQRNTIYVLAKQHPLDSIEAFGVYLADHFLSRNEDFFSVSVAIGQPLWEAVPVNGKPHPFACRRAGEEIWTTEIDMSRELTRIISGIKGLHILKTTKSGFSNFKHDEYTTLKDTDDRILQTELSARWTFSTDVNDFLGPRKAIIQTLLATFAEHDSLSVQHTLHAMGEAVLEAQPSIRRIELDMPNKHNLLFNLTPFKMENKNEIFVVTDEPFGVIKGTME